MTRIMEGCVRTIFNLNSFTNDLPHAADAELTSALKMLQPYADGDVIFHAHDEPDAMFKILSGEVSLCNYSADGQDILLTKFFPGDWIGITGIMDGNPRLNTAISVGTTQLQRLSRTDFHRLCEQHPAIQHRFSLMVSNHVRVLLNLLVDASLLRLPARIVRSIQRLVVSMGKLDENGVDYIECSHEELARFVSASRQSTSVELKKLERAGIVRSTYGKIYILNKEALHERSEHLTSIEPIAAVYEDSQG